MSSPMKMPPLGGFAHLKSQLLGFSGLWSKWFHYGWVVSCSLIAVAALYNLVQLAELRSDVSARRLLETSIQDLLVQSAALRHLSAKTNQERNDNLSRYGFDSPIDLLDQLNARLIVARSSHSDFDVKQPIEDLAELLNQIQRPLGRQAPISNELINQLLDHWFIALNSLVDQTRRLALSHEELGIRLQRRSLLLALFVLVYSFALVKYHNWSRLHHTRQFVTEMENLHDETRKDPLTSLLNRRGWTFFTSKTIKRLAKFGRTSISIVIIDIDHFKKYNDTYGHDAGDERLVEFANMIKSQFRPCDLVARIGGEEFAVMLPNCTVEDAKRIVDRINNNEACNVPFSAGIASLEECRTVEGALVIADEALYKAKNQGRHRAVISHPT